MLLADRCIAALRSAVGDALREGTKVLRLFEEGNQVRIETDREELSAEVVVCCAGAATAGLVPGFPPSLPLRASREQVAFFAMADGACPDVPVVIEQSEPLVYGLPTPSLGLYKLAHHHAGPQVAEADLGPPAQEEDRQMVSAIVERARRLIPGIDPVPRRSERCVYDTTPDTDFVLDRIGAGGRIVVGAGTSGHGFKFGPLLGETLARLALGEVEGGVVPLRRFAAGRLEAAEG